MNHSTRIVNSSNGNNVAELSDTWVTTFQNYSGKTSSDPRLGHVLRGPGAVIAPLAGISFADGSDRPFWGYTFTLAPGQTGIIMNFAVVQPSKAAAAAKSAQLVGLPANALQFMTAAEKNEVLNFIVAAPVAQPTAVPVSKPAEVPEADTLLLLGGGMGGLATWIGYKLNWRLKRSDNETK